MDDMTPSSPSSVPKIYALPTDSIPTIAHMPPKKSVHFVFVPDRHISDSDSDISLGKAGRSIADGGSSMKSSTFATTSCNDDFTIPTVSQVPLKKSIHFVPDRHMSDSDSDISLVTCKTGSSADSGYCTSASASCITVTVSKMPQWAEESCVKSSSVKLQACSKNPSGMLPRLRGHNHSDPTIPTIAQKPLKRSVHFVPDRHNFCSDSDSDISLGKTGSSSADGGTRTAPASSKLNSNSVTKISQWDLEESCDESSSVSSKSTVATSGCNSVVSFAEALIGKDGGILMLPNAATSLLFSPHSISNQIDITLEILHNPVAFPDLRADETLVSPYVFCGPHGWTFHKPVLLTFPHCGMSDNDDLTLLVSETSSQQAPDWTEVSSATPGIEYFVRDSECLVYTSHFTGFSFKSKGPKQVRLLAFSSLSDNLYRLRVYCINDTKDVVDRIKKEEQEFGFKQTDRGVSMTFLNNKKDLHLKAHLETPGWKFLNSSQELVISYESVRGKRDGNVLFNLQAEPESDKDTSIISLRIHALQEGNTDSPTYIVAEKVHVGWCDHKGACNCKTPSHLQVQRVHTDITDQPKVSFKNSQGSHRNLTIPHKLRTELCIKLDPKKACGKDWRSLASELGLDERIEFFDSKESPTELVLQEFEMSGKTLKDLTAILTGIERPDTAYLVQEHLQTTSCDLPSPFNDSGVGSPDTDASERDGTPSPGSDKKFFPNSLFRAEERTSPKYMHRGESVPSHDLYNSSANTETSERSTTTSSTSDQKFFPNGPSLAEERNSPQYMHRGESVPSNGLYNSSANTEASERDSTFSPAFDQMSLDLPNSHSRAGEQNSSQHMHCGESVPSHELYNSSANTGASERSTTTSGTSDQKFFPNGPSLADERNSSQYMPCGESVPSNELYDSHADTEASERSSPTAFFLKGPSGPERNCLPYLQCGQSVSSHGINDSYQSATEPKLIQENEVESSMQGLVLNSTASDSDETGNVEVEEVNDSNSEMSQDDQKCTEVMVVSIPGREVEHFAEGRRETAV
ncbi:PREDICTED: uncharacterized protein LOC109471296 [Branchiostoma belcheri]|uniref:Netrin receptor UNC5 n=1 Tax=Branchiostoma belcheri TaxID=7741 RepID=A0A6P4YAQ7_BRABE|nr:PREDICTED: uncharacterized protein LOC109471296 [Branchiostoma belcheri]